MTRALLIAGGYLHLLGMAVYVGGTIVMEFVLGPAQKQIPPAQAQVVSQRSADRFLVLAWSALGLLLGSGLLRLFAMHGQRVLIDGDLFSTAYGRSLLVMIAGWCVLVINGTILTFVMRPKLGGKLSAAASLAQVQGRQQDMVRVARMAARIVRADLVIALLIVFAGASIHAGGLL